MSWEKRQVTFGTRNREYHSHSYYDIRVFNDSSGYIALHQLDFADRTPRAGEAAKVGVIECDESSEFIALGETTAWSWQQGPMAQWQPGSKRLFWNERDGDRFITRIFDLETGARSSIGLPTYALSPSGAYALSLNMSRLDLLRPGYGYQGAANEHVGEKKPADDGVWRIDLLTGKEQLILSLRSAVEFLKSQIGWSESVLHKIRHYHYWFNHAKIAPDGRRFTVKLRFKLLGGSWSDEQGVSLTCGADGSELRLLAHATSHVIWKDNSHLYLWQKNGFYMYADEAPVGRRLRQIGRGLVNANAHLRYMPGELSDCFIFDTPYREDIELLLHNERTGETQTLSSFGRHRPAAGPFRCDLHPCPSPDGRRIVVTSLNDGGRQVYLLERSSSSNKWGNV